MTNILRILLIVIVFIVVSYFGLAFVMNRGLIKNEKLNESFNSIAAYLPKSLPTLPENIADSQAGVAFQSAIAAIGPQFKTTLERSQIAVNEARNVLGTSIMVNDQPAPVHEKAFLYGRYLYCQQVVEDYEKQTSASAKTSP